MPAAMDGSIEPFVTKAFATLVPSFFIPPNHLLVNFRPWQNGNNYRSIGKFSNVLTPS
jgi:hypothetical protein